MDSNFNTVPNTGTFGNAVNKINENFLLAKVAIDGIELSTTKNKGIFPSVSSLETTVPSPNVGDWAGVGTAFPVKLYVCNTAGTWADSGSTWNGGDINLSDYVTNTTFNGLVWATDNIYKKSNYNDGNNIIDFNTIHLITDNPEFICVAIDTDDKILYGIKADGQPYFGVGCPQQVKDYVNEQINKILGTDDITTTIDSLKEIEAFLKDFTNSDTLKKLLDLKANVDEVRATTDDIYKKSNPNDSEGNVVDTNTIVSVDDNPEYIKALTDSVGKLMEAIGLDGIRKFFAGINVQGTLQCVTDNPDYIAVWLDNQDRIIFGFKANGDIYFGYGCPSQIKEIFNSVEKELSDVIKKISIGNNIYPSDIYSMTDSISRTIVETDVDNRLLSSFEDGIRNIYTPFAIQGMANYLTDSLTYKRLVLDKDNRILWALKNDKLSSTILENFVKEFAPKQEEDDDKTDIVSLNGGTEELNDIFISFKKLLFKNYTVMPWPTTKLDNLTLIHFTDIHNNVDLGKRIKEFVDKFKTIHGITAIDDVICTGDIAGGDFTDSDHYLWKTLNIENYLAVIGNHDKYGAHIQGYDILSRKLLYQYFFKPYIDSWSVVQSENAESEGKLYYYKDYPNYEYRVIALDIYRSIKLYKTVDGNKVYVDNTFDDTDNSIIYDISEIGNISNPYIGMCFVVTGNPRSVDTAKIYVIDTITEGKVATYSELTKETDTDYQEEQDVWLKSVLGDAKTKGYHCIIAAHDTPNLTSYIDCSWSAIKTHEDLTQNSPTNYFTNTIDTFVNDGGVVACMLVGHQHDDIIGLHNNILCIVCDAATRYQFSDTSRNDGKMQDSFNITSLNKERGIITLRKIGANKDQYLRGRNVFVYDYINKKLLYQI